MSSSTSASLPRSDSESHSTRSERDRAERSERTTSRRSAADDSTIPPMKERDNQRASIPTSSGYYSSKDHKHDYNKGEMKSGSGTALSYSQAVVTMKRDSESSKPKETREREHYREHRDPRERPERDSREDHHREDRYRDHHREGGGSSREHSDRSSGERPSSPEKPRTLKKERGEHRHSGGVVNTQDTRQEYERSKRDDRDQGKAQNQEAPAQPSNIGGLDDIDDGEMVIVEHHEAQEQQPQQQPDTSNDGAIAQAIQDQEMRSYSDSESSSTESEAGAVQRAPGPPAESQSQSMVSRFLGGNSGGSSSESRYREKYRQLKSEVQSLERHLEYEHHHRKQAVTAYQHMEFNFNNARRHTMHADEEIKGLKMELANTKQQLSDAVNLSEVRGKELKGAQVFLTKADALSTSDVANKVVALNEEVFQAAALLGDMLGCEMYDEGVDRVEARNKAIAENRDAAAKVLGGYLVEVLAQESLKPGQDAPNQLLVQIVVQSALTKWCSSVCTAWKPGDKTTSKVIKDLYEEIRSFEDQAVAGRWRSLTRSRLSFSYSTSTWATEVMDVIKAVVAVAGWAAPAEGQEQFEKRLSSIFRAVQDVRKATGEDVTSADLEPIFISPGTDFEPGYMEDAYGDERSSGKKKDAPPEKVVSTSGLGLKKVVFKKPGGNGGQIMRTWEPLSFPKVVLEKTIREALEPPPPSKGRRKKAEPGSGGGGVLSIIGF